MTPREMSGTVTVTLSNHIVNMPWSNLPGTSIEPQDGTHLQRQYANHAEAKADITDYIIGFYHCKFV